MRVGTIVGVARTFKVSPGSGVEVRVCWNNGAAESFFAALKNELYHRERSPPGPAPGSPWPTTSRSPTTGNGHQPWATGPQLRHAQPQRRLAGVTTNPRNCPRSLTQTIRWSAGCKALSRIVQPGPALLAADRSPPFRLTRDESIGVASLAPARRPARSKRSAIRPAEAARRE
jgi:hypothetical protein